MANLLAEHGRRCNLGVGARPHVDGHQDLVRLSGAVWPLDLSEVHMKPALAALGGSLALAGCATGPKPEDHAAHQPPSAAAAAPAAATPGQMDSTMNSMQEMHDRMMAARTPEERAKLMPERKKLMQGGMAMMGQMRGGKGGMGMGGGMSMGPEMMGKRMDMRETMMKTMVDREAMKPPVAKQLGERRHEPTAR